MSPLKMEEVGLPSRSMQMFSIWPCNRVFRATTQSVGSEFAGNRGEHEKMSRFGKETFEI